MTKLLLPLIFITAFICSCNIKLHDNLLESPPLFTPDDGKYIDEVYAARRGRLLKNIEDAVIIISSTSDFNGGRHVYRQNNNLFYLTGFKEIRSLMILNGDSIRPYTLAVIPRTVKSYSWMGIDTSMDEIQAIYRPDTIITTIEIQTVYKQIVGSGKDIYIEFKDEDLRDRLNRISKSLDVKLQLNNLEPIINEMRVIKDPFEISMLVKANEITGKAFEAVCQHTEPGKYEFEIEALLEYVFHKNGASMPGFRSIVGSGPNTTSLHYELSKRKMIGGDLLLLDIGAEVNQYGADVSRTIPVNGKFTKEQKEIYSLVLKAQEDAIKAMIPGKSIFSGHSRANKIIVKGLYDLGLMTDQNSYWQRKFYILYPASHYLGLDVHDVGDYGSSYMDLMQKMVSYTMKGRDLEPGMVLTIEPGLYFRENGMNELFDLFSDEADSTEINDFIQQVTPVYEKYKNIGVRIEDDILITETGNRNLSAPIPKKIEEIERLMAH